MKLFSTRHKKALSDRSLKVSVSERLRGRTWAELLAHNESWDETDDTNWNYRVSILDLVEGTLMRLYGKETLVPASMPVDPESPEAKREALKWHVQMAPSAEVLDVIQVAADKLEGEKRDAFIRAINSAFEDESCPWRISDGTFFKIDSEFLEKHVLSGAQHLLSKEGFSGAQEEFVEARNDLTGGDTKDAILKACKSMESVLKVMTGDQVSNASVLVRKLAQTDALRDLPPDMRAGFAEGVLLCLPTMRNKLAGHGQGSQVVVVQKPYAKLAVNLAASLSTFLIELHLATQPPPPQPEPPAPLTQGASLDDEIPF